MDQTPTLPYSGGIGGYREELEQTLADAPKHEPVRQEEKLINTAMTGSGMEQYHALEEDTKAVIMKMLPLAPEQEGPAYDKYQPYVKMLEDMRANRVKDLQKWENAMLHTANPAHAMEMVELCKGVIAEIDDALSRIVYKLPDEVLKNPYGAEYAHLLCLRAPNEKQAAEIEDAVAALNKTRLAWYNQGSMAMSQAANDIQTALEQKLPGAVFAEGLFYEAGYNVPQAIHAYGMAENKGNVYQQALNNMGSQEAIRAANPNAYGAAVFTTSMVEFLDFLKGGAKGVAAPTTDMAYGELSKEAKQAIKKYATSLVGDKIKDESIKAFFNNFAEYYYGQTGGN